MDGLTDELQELRAENERMRAALAAERERCAKIAESKKNFKGKNVPYSLEIAAEIRAGKESP